MRAISGCFPSGLLQCGSLQRRLPASSSTASIFRALREAHPRRARQAPMKFPKQPQKPHECKTALTEVYQLIHSPCLRLPRGDHSIRQSLHIQDKKVMRTRPIHYSLALLLLFAGAAFAAEIFTYQCGYCKYIESFGGMQNNGYKCSKCGKGYMYRVKK